MLYPLTFRPIFKERVWGGRNLERLFGKPLPPGVRIGESWEISDRPGDASVVANGPFAGKDLHWLTQHHASELLGSARPQNGRFPLLIKLLDAQETLSLQVHPPAARASALGGEPKTEMWYVAQAAPRAELLAGLKRGTSRADFERKTTDGTVADCFHRFPVHAGDALMLPSGRVHALGAGLVIFEIQQNSDTTYRVFDWNRVGLDGKPRPLHIAQSLASIDFDDFEPALLSSPWTQSQSGEVRTLVRDPLFSVEEVRSPAGLQSLTLVKPAILGMLSGALRAAHRQTAITLNPGQFCLLPAGLAEVSLDFPAPSCFLRIEL